MQVPQSITVFELDEDLEVSGKRSMASKRTVIPLSSPPAELAGIRFQLDNSFHFVEGLQVGWFDAEKDADYTLANDSLWYLEITVGLPGASEKQYDRAWDAFRKTRVETLANLLEKSSWGIGRGIASRRGQDLFIIELDGLEYPLWSLYLSIRSNDTYESCWNIAKQVEGFFERLKDS
jgi:hypothetical protein